MLHFVKLICFLLALRDELVSVNIEVILLTSPQRRNSIESINDFNSNLQTEFAHIPGAVLTLGSKVRQGNTIVEGRFCSTILLIC